MSSSSTRTSVSRVPRSHRARRKHRWLWVCSIAALLLSAIAATLVWRATHDESDIASDAMVTSSSAEPGFPGDDAVASGSGPRAGWRSAGEASGAWLELSWPRAHVLRQVVLVRNPVQDPGVTNGFLTFGDGSYLQLTLSTTSQKTVVPFIPRSVDRLRFTASAVGDGARNVTIAQIIVSAQPSDSDLVADGAPDGNAALTATVTQRDGAGGSDTRALQDGTGAPGVAGTGADWTVDQPRGAWVELDWDRPRELSSIELVGSTGSKASLAGATITFGDGAHLPIGAVLDAPERPTIVSFMPRVTRSVRIGIDRVDGDGSLSLGELRAYQRATPRRSPTPPAVSSSRSPSSAPSGIACDGSTAGAPQSGLVVRCPPAGSTVDGTVTFQLSAPGYSRVSATVWPADGSTPGTPVSATPDAAGAAQLAVDLGTAPPGPLTVEFAADGQGRKTSTVHFQLYRRADSPATDIASSPAADGRTLAYADEFDQPISLSRTGEGADYAASKPTHDGVQDFGDAIFADPAQGFDNVHVVDNRYLRIDVEPNPPGYVDPDGGERTHLGGLLASARPGGSGFSAQYGYFEARMLMPAAPGTWPAFWMLPSDNLITATPTVAEIDAVELYGHDPDAACHSTHDYKDGKDSGVSQCGQRFPTDRAALSWHTYGVSILPTGNTFYIDGHVVATAPQVAGGAAPMFFLVNLALGGGWPVQLQGVQDRATLYVDYIRVYV